MDIVHIFAFLAGLALVAATWFSAISTFVLPRSARSRLNRLVFGLLRKIFGLFLRFAKTYRRRDAILAYYAPFGMLLLLPAWYALVSCGYAAMYWAAGVEGFLDAFRMSVSSLLTLGFADPATFPLTVIVFSEAMTGLILVALLIAYLPTIYAAFARREQAVNMLDVRAGNPPSTLEMLLRFKRIHGLDKLGDYWRSWEGWFADIEESHTTLPMLVFFRSPRAENSWITAAGAVLDTASLTLSCLDVTYEPSAALCIRAGYLALRRIANYFDIPNPQEPRFPADPISIRREEFEEILTKLEAADLPIRPNHEQAWKDFAGWRVNYDRALVTLCRLVMAPPAPWSSDRTAAASPGEA
jgi:hypothetical protein